MMNTINRGLLLIVMIVYGCGSASTTTPEEPPVITVNPDYPYRAIIHWRPFRLWDEDTKIQAARADMISLNMQDCACEEGRDIIKELKAINPDLQVVAYMSLLNVIEPYSDTTFVRDHTPFALDHYYLVKDDWAFTTTGDTIMTWQKTIFLNPIKNGQLYRGLIDKTVDLIDRYRSSYGNLINGVMHDYFLYNVYLNPNVADQVHGDIDLDGDGVILGVDDDERALLYQWQLEYVRAFRDRFGPNFIQIGNGRPPQEDPQLAAMLNGIFYEHYPTSPWGFTDMEGVTRLLERQRDGYLSTAKGRTWSIVSNATYSTNNQFCLYASMVAGCFYAELYGSYSFGGWSINVDCGEPLGPAVVEAGQDGVTIVRRPFQNGETYLTFNGYGFRDEVDFIPVINE